MEYVRRRNWGRDMSNILTDDPGDLNPLKQFSNLASDRAHAMRGSDENPLTDSCFFGEYSLKYSYNMQKRKRTRNLQPRKSGAALFGAPVAPPSEKRLASLLGRGSEEWRRRRASNLSNGSSIAGTFLLFSKNDGESGWPSASELLNMGLAAGVGSR